MDLTTAKPYEKYKAISACLRADPTVSIRMLCMALGVSRSGYYRWKNAEGHRIDKQQEELHLAEQIMQVLDENMYIPYRDILDLVNEKRIAVGEKTVCLSKIYRVMDVYDL